MARPRWSIVLVGPAFALAAASCSTATGADEDPRCIPGDQKACACPGGGQGAQICTADGHGYGSCFGCGKDAGDDVAPPLDAPEVDGSVDDGDAALDAPDVPKDAGPYVLSDCIKSPRNGSEICDDESWSVATPGKPLVMVCIDGNGGTIFLSRNTGPKMSDGVARCQGWETTGLKAWDYLDYIAKLECDAPQKQLEVDLSDRVGTGVWFGVHDKPTGGGHMTQSCLAWKK